MQTSPSQPAAAGGASAVAFRRHGLCCVGLLAAALCLRLIGVTGTSVWHDESVSILVSRMAWGDLLFRMPMADHQLPLFYALLRIWTAAGAIESAVWMRLLPVLLSIAGVWYAIRWGRLHSHRIAWLAGGLAATAPMLVHYAQELRCYAMMYSAMMAGLYYAESLAGSKAIKHSVGLLIALAVCSHAHYVGVLAASGVWMYAAVRGIGFRRLAIVTASWLFLCAPIISWGVHHARLRSETGFWAPPLSAWYALDLWHAWTGIGSTGQVFGGHGSLAAIEQAAASILVSWGVLVFTLVIRAAVGWAVLMAIVSAWNRPRGPASALLIATLTVALLTWAVCGSLVSVALERTTFAVFLPVMALAALAAGAGSNATAKTASVMQRAGTIGAISIIAAWTIVSLVTPLWPIERRPDEQGAFAWIRDQWQAGDLLFVLPTDLQASAGYHLGKVAKAADIQTTELPRFVDAPGGLQMLPVAQEHDPDWLTRITFMAEQLHETYGRSQAIWIMTRGAGRLDAQGDDADLHRFADWLDSNYQVEASNDFGERWKFVVRRYVPEREL